MLKSALLAAGASLATALPTLAQQSAPPVALSIGVVNSYHFHTADSRVVNYYALGSHLKVVLRDTWLLGFAQQTSLAPQHLLAATPSLYIGGSRLAEYAASGGARWHLAPRTYAQGEVQAGFGTWRQRGDTVQEWLAEEWPRDHQATFLTAAAKAGVGYRLTSFLALEAQASYHRYFTGNKLPVSTGELHNLSAGISLVGTMGLIKRR